MKQKSAMWNSYQNIPQGTMFLLEDSALLKCAPWFKNWKPSALVIIVSGDSALYLAHRHDISGVIGVSGVCPSNYTSVTDIDRYHMSAIPGNAEWVAWLGPYTGYDHHLYSAEEPPYLSGLSAIRDPF